MPSLPSDPNLEMPADPHATYSPEMSLALAGKVAAEDLANAPPKAPSSHEPRPVRWTVVAPLAAPEAPVPSPDEPSATRIYESLPVELQLESGAAEEAPRATYELRRVLGMGGCGEVWEARQISLGRLVAVKRIRRDNRSGWTTTSARLAEDLFRKEAVTAALLEHPNIVPIHDLGSDASGSPLLAMKLVRGEPWDEVLGRDLRGMARGEFLAKHLAILIDVAQAVAFAHSRGIIHRDLKPAQVMIGEFGETLLMDWGLAVRLSEKATGTAVYDRSFVHDLLVPVAASASNPAGTPSMMAPEQAVEDPTGLGFWTDVFLLGATLYTVLTGTPPHDGRNSQVALEQARKCSIVPPEVRTPGLETPPELSALCLRAMSKDPYERPASVRSFVEGLNDYLSGAGRRRESLRIAEDIRDRLAENPASYQVLTELQAQLNRAASLWADNPAVAELSVAIPRAFAERALALGDLNLARIHLDALPDSPDTRRLLADLGRRLEEARSHRRQRRLFQAIAATLLVAIALGALAFNRRLAAERDAQAELLHRMGERVKELTCIYAVGRIMRTTTTPAEAFPQVVELLPLAWQWPEVTAGRIVVDDQEYRTANWDDEPVATQRAEIVVQGEMRGYIEVAYLTHTRKEAEGPFLAEERNLINALAILLSEVVGRAPAPAAGS